MDDGSHPRVLSDIRHRTVLSAAPGSGAGPGANDRQWPGKRGRRGRASPGDSRRLRGSYRNDARHTARLRLSRRRAHDRACPRGRAASERRKRAQVRDAASPVWHRLSAHRRRGVCGGVHRLRAAGVLVVVANRLPHPAAAGNRRRELRGHQVQWPAPGRIDRQNPGHAGVVAAAIDNTPAR